MNEADQLVSAQCRLSNVGEVTGGGRSSGIGANDRADRSMPRIDESRSATAGETKETRARLCDGGPTVSFITVCRQCSQEPLHGSG